MKGVELVMAAAVNVCMGNGQVWGVNGQGKTRHGGPCSESRARARDPPENQQRSAGRPGVFALLVTSSVRPWGPTFQHIWSSDRREQFGRIDYGSESRYPVLGDRVA